MIKGLIKFFLSLIFILIIFAGIVFSFYYFSPEIKPGEYGALYKIYGKNKGFTGKILPPGKYYFFISGIYPGIYKVYPVKLYSKSQKFNIKLFDGTEISGKLVWKIDKKNIDKFFENENFNDIQKILNVYLKSDFEDYFSQIPVYNLISDNFSIEFSKKILPKLNGELSLFGIKIEKIVLDKITLPEEKIAIIEKLRKNKLYLENLKIETEKKVAEEKIKNKLKLEKLQYLLKKAEIEKEILKKKMEAQNMVWENQKKRLTEEVEILSKPGGEYAAKLEAIRILVNGLKQEKKLQNASQIYEKVFKK